MIWFVSQGSMNQMKESTTTSVLESWRMAPYSGGLKSSGNGDLNWSGNPICGQWRGAGVACYGSRSGDPSTSPGGGHNCRVNLGNGWNGALEYYMSTSHYDTYTYICNGAQHSSSQRFSSRVWVRSPDSQKDW